MLKRSLGLFNENQVVYKGLTCNLSTNEVTIDEKLLPIQGNEFALLVYFLQNRGIILTKEQIFDRIWGFDSETNDHSSRGLHQQFTQTSSGYWY